MVKTQILIIKIIIRNNKIREKFLSLIESTWIIKIFNKRVFSRISLGIIFRHIVLNMDNIIIREK
jgi:hypothetical protein